MKLLANPMFVIIWSIKLLKQEASSSLGTSDKGWCWHWEIFQESHSSAYLSALSAGSHSPGPHPPTYCLGLHHHRHHSIPACCLSHYHLSSMEWNRRTLSHASSCQQHLGDAAVIFFFFKNESWRWTEKHVWSLCSYVKISDHLCQDRMWKSYSYYTRFSTHIDIILSLCTGLNSSA